jgi:hypothetical protein
MDMPEAGAMVTGVQEAKVNLLYPNEPPKVDSPRSVERREFLFGKNEVALGESDRARCA